ncbi:hypothetical protein [Chitinimonas sp.]|uniref:hypothetical protein n=1 Tax=Chitinimonas sp. TaxID=1934313 RepID=UPI002F926700
MSDAHAMGVLAGMGIFFVLLIIPFLIAAIFYCIALQGTMNKLSPANKPFEGALIWLSFIPILGGIWHLVYICMLSSAIQKDYQAAGQQNDGALPMAIGIAVCSVASVIPLIGMLAALVGFVLWIMYWLRINAYRKTLPVGGLTAIPA